MTTRGLWVALMLLAAARPAAAQVIEVGAHGGVNLARLSGDTSVDTELKPEPVGGVDFAITLIGELAFRAELEYAGKGARVTSTMNGSTPVDYSLSYLALPLNLRYQLGTGSPSVYLFAGTTLGALLAANERSQGGAERDVKDQLSGVEVTLDLGGGIVYRMTPNLGVNLDVRYALGLSKVAQDSAVLDVSSWKTNTVQIVLGVTYRFGVFDSGGPSFPAMPPGMPPMMPTAPPY
jgi:opacity protein-like surface antigen